MVKIPELYKFLLSGHLIVKLQKNEAIFESNFDHITCFQYSNYFLAKYLYIINIHAFPMSINDMQFVTTKLTSQWVLLRKKYASLFASRAVILEYKKVCTYLQGISYWNVKSDLGLTDENMQDRFGLKVVLEFWDREILSVIIESFRLRIKRKIEQKLDKN